MGRFDPPSKKVQVDVRLDQVVLKSLEKEPQRRYQQASEVKTDVESISKGGQPAEPTLASIGRSSGAEAGGGDTEPARQQVRGPAIGLLVTGIVNWAGSIIAVFVLEPTSPSMRSAIVGSISVLIILFSGLILPRVSSSFFRSYST